MGINFRFFVNKGDDAEIKTDVGNDTLQEILREADASGHQKRLKAAIKGQLLKKYGIEKQERGTMPFTFLTSTGFWMQSWTK